jgi:hypothetical protein
MNPYRTAPKTKAKHDAHPSGRAVILVVLVTCPLIVELARAQRWFLGFLLLAFVTSLVVVLLRTPRGPKARR